MMIYKQFRYLFFVALSIVSMFGFAEHALAQSGSQGTVVVTVTDNSGATVPGASLELTEINTNDVRKAVADSTGNYSFINLAIGPYKLRVARQGYSAKEYPKLVVQAGQTNTVVAQLQVGQVNETVQVTGDTTPVIDATSNQIGLVVDMKQIEDLPLQGRDLTSFSQLVAGYNGTFNGLPSNDQGSNIDGVIGQSARMKFTGNVQPAVSPRLEAIEQMTVQTDQLDLNSGFGQSSTQVNFVSRRGSNRFHGRAYEDFRNSGLNANSWVNNAAGVRKNKLILNDFGVSVGGPVLHDKLFFFGSFAMQKQPGSTPNSNSVFTSAAQAGTFTYSGGTVNVLNLVHGYNAALPGTVNAEIAQQFQKINQAVASGGLTSSADPNYNTLNWNFTNPQTNYFPSGRIDYNLSQKVRMYLSVLVSKYNSPSANGAFLPGSGYANQSAANTTKNLSASYGIDYIVNPRLINQFKAGYLYNYTGYAYNSNQSLYDPNTAPTVYWNFPGANGNMSGQVYNLPVGTFYPILNLSDSLTWEHAGHNITGGFSWYREQDHYYNPPQGIPAYNLGLTSGDPALQAFSSAALPNASPTDLVHAEQLYAILTGRIGSNTSATGSGVYGSYAYNVKTGQYNHSVGPYNLNELSLAWGLFAEDSWKISPTFTLNYGLRWDFTGPQHDLTGAYHSVLPDGVFGPSGIDNLFNPGSLKGNMNPIIPANPRPYNSWNVSPQPAIGFAWSPKIENRFLKSVFGDNDTVVRGGFALRRFTEPYQYFWNAASNFGAFYYQNFYLNANNTGAAGTYAPGSLSLSTSNPQPVPAFGLSPVSYQETAPESQFTFQGSTSAFGIDPNIKQPYAESWNFGIQRSLGRSRALEIRYNGNRTIHQWLFIDPNEVNIFENGFLAEFQRAQANLRTVNGTATFSDAGQAHATPILDAAFGGSNAPDYTNATFIRYLQTGQAGALAASLAGVSGGSAPFFCNLVGAGFSPCPNNANATGAGAGYPINFFQANPYAAGTNACLNQGFNCVGQTGYMVAAASSNYNGMQIDFRQGSWNGLQLDINYTLSHSLGIASNNQWTALYNAFTLRDLHRSYGPSIFDLRHVMHANGTYDLPLGHGKMFLNSNDLVDYLLGHWTLGTIITYQSGAPAQLTGGYQTFNDVGDDGLTLTGTSVSQIQKSIGVHRLAGKTIANLIDPKFVNSSGGANSAYISPNTTPGTIGNVIYIHGPNAFTEDLSVSKAIPIKGEVNFRLQGEFLNVWNHPVFGNTSGSFDAGVQDSGFGTGTVTNESSGFGRIVELRANIQF